MINRVVLVGRLTKDPELRKTSSNASVTNFTLAVDDRPSKDREKTTSYFNIITWNMTADYVSQYIKKGHLVGIDGKLQQRTYENKEGQKVNVVEVIAENVQSYQPRENSEPVAATTQPTTNNAAPVVVEQPAPQAFVAVTDDDLPF